MNKIKVMLVDDQQLLLDGLKTILSINGDMEIALAQSGEAAVELSETFQPDIILMDIKMPGMGGVAATKRIKERCPRTIILILTTFDDDAFIIDALRYGASGYLLKDIDGEKLIRSVYEALSGNLLLTGKVAQKLAMNVAEKNEQSRLQRNVLKDKFELTERETDIARALVEGMTNREISDSLYLTQGTVKNYLSGIYSKIGTSDRAKAVLLLKDILFRD
ncbi:MAG: response regulator transcription factor [Eubacteriales bacterium]|nr:response regulator transcription factor [Eubacteriales bacterium]